MKVEYLGNQELLQLKKTAFLASSTISSETVLQVYDWATEMRNRGECVVSGFSSKLEQDVLETDLFKSSNHFFLSFRELTLPQNDYIMFHLVESIHNSQCFVL